MTKRNLLTIKLATTLFCLTCFATGQTPPPSEQKAVNSSCSNIATIVGSTLNCSSPNRQQSKAIANIPAILKLLLTDQGFFEQILAQMKEMPRIVCPPNTGNTIIGSEVSGNSAVGIVDNNLHDCIVNPTYNGPGTGIIMGPQFQPTTNQPIPAGQPLPSTTPQTPPPANTPSPATAPASPPNVASPQCDPNGHGTRFINPQISNSEGGVLILGEGTCVIGAKINNALVAGILLQPSPPSPYAAADSARLKLENDAYGKWVDEVRQDAGAKSLVEQDFSELKSTLSELWKGADIDPATLDTWSNEVEELERRYLQVAGNRGKTLALLDSGHIIEIPFNTTTQPQQ